MHGVEADDFESVAEGLERGDPGGPEDPLAGVDDVLDDDRPVLVELGEADDVPHRGAGPFRGLVGEDLAKQVGGGVLVAFLALRDGVVGAGRGEPGERGRRVAPRVDLGDVGALVRGVGVVGLVDVDGEAPVVQRGADSHPGLASALGGPAGSGESIGGVSGECAEFRKSHRAASLLLGVNMGAEWAHGSFVTATPLR